MKAAFNGFFLHFLFGALATDRCQFGGLVQIDVKGASHKEHDAFYAALAHPFLGGALPKNSSSMGELMLSDPIEACGPLAPFKKGKAVSFLKVRRYTSACQLQFSWCTSYPGSIVLVSRGACSFKDKALAVQVGCPVY